MVKREEQEKKRPKRAKGPVEGKRGEAHSSTQCGQEQQDCLSFPAKRFRYTHKKKKKRHLTSKKIEGRRGKGGGKSSIRGTWGEGRTTKKEAIHAESLKRKRCLAIGRWRGGDDWYVILS